MANSLHLSREVKVYVKFGTKYWEIPVLDGFSFSQSTNTAEVSLKEMANGSDVSRRGRRIFNDSLAPAEWSFSTYGRPFTRDVSSADEHHAVEEVLWAMMAGAEHDEYNASTDKWTDVIDNAATGATIDFASSNQMIFPTATIYFKFPKNGDGGADLWYQIDDATINECGMDFDIDGITTLNWSGMGTKISEPASAPTVSTLEVVAAELTSTSSFIRNRLTQLDVTAADTTTFPGAANNGVYNLVLTGGNITITNNVEYVTPSSLGIVNVPLGHTMGTRSVTGGFTCYLDHNTAASADLLEDLMTGSTSITNSFNLVFKVGGASATPAIHITMPTAHLEVPTHSIEDVISAEVNFHALPSDISDTDEVTVKYIGITSQ
jgi:hypothetical protein